MNFKRLVAKARIGWLAALLIGVCSHLPLVNAQQPSPSSGTSRVTGQVSNAATRALLEGAAIEITALGLRTLTDGMGRYTFENLPAGSHTLSATYSGLNREERVVQVLPGAASAV